MVRFLLSLTLLAIFGCGGKQNECTSVFFGGEIVNPTSDYVVLYRNDMYIDSARLDDTNRFNFRLQGIDDGLYHFDHSPELQYVYLQEGDSLLLRLNTVEFDESLVYSGTGSEINNFLIEMFLTFEDEEPMIYQYFKLDPDAFHQKIDSLRVSKIQLLKELHEENNFSDQVLAMAKASIDYNTYIFKEQYPFYHKKKTGEETIHELDDNFYSYRKSIDLNNRELTYFRPYFDFMKYHFGNLSYMDCMKHCSTEEKPISSHLHFNKHKLYLVDSLVQESDLRDILFRNIAMDYLLKEHEANEECQIFIDKFRSLSKNEDHKKEITHLYEGIQQLQPQKELPNLVLKNLEGEEVSLKEMTKGRTTVFYFWTGSQKKHLKNVTSHVKMLEEKYPDHHFVGINLRTSFPQWKLLVQENNLDQDSQLFAEDFKEVQMAMIVDGLNKCVITKDNEIVDAFANLYYSF